MALLDGKKLAEKIQSRLKADFAALKINPVLAIVSCGENEVSQKFIGQKKKTAEEIGVSVKEFHFKEDISGSELRNKIGDIVRDKKIDGVIIQMPLPSHMNAQDVLNAVIPEKDVDVLSSRAVGNFSTGKSKLVPPVTGAIQALSSEYDIAWKGKKIVVLGAGRLVGKPVTEWLLKEGLEFSVLTDQTGDISSYTHTADIIVSGVGRPGLITGDMVKDGVIIFDAGTSGSGGSLRGDADFDSVSPKASFITPVPGGIGPLTVIMIFQNLLSLINKK